MHAEDHEPDISSPFRWEHILLDEPVELEPNTKLLVTVLPKDIEHEEWLVLSKKGLEAAYDNGEEDYSLDLVKVQILNMNENTPHSPLKPTESSRIQASM